MNKLLYENELRRLKYKEILEYKGNENNEGLI